MSVRPKRIHFPKPSKRAPFGAIDGIGKCNTTAQFYLAATNERCGATRGQANIHMECFGQYGDGVWDAGQCPNWL
jgi:hypothetical protein